MMILLAKVVQTCWACPSQWDAWTPDGTYVYLRFRFGRGTVTINHLGMVAEFSTDDPLDGAISLEEFMAATGLELAAGAEVS
jgi:hypothetical protein